MADVASIVGRMAQEPCPTNEKDAVSEGDDPDDQHTRACTESRTTQEAGDVAESALRVRCDLEARAQRREQGEQGKKTKDESVQRDVPVEQKVGRVVVAGERCVIPYKDDECEPDECQGESEHLKTLSPRSEQAERLVSDGYLSQRWAQISTRNT